MALRQLLWRRNGHLDARDLLTKNRRGGGGSSRGSSGGTSGGNSGSNGGRGGAEGGRVSPTIPMIDDTGLLSVCMMSATMPGSVLSAYFGNCPRVKFPGRTFPVTVKYLETALAVTDHRLDPMAKVGT